MATFFTNEQEIKRAAQTIAACENDLNRHLSAGEQRDLLCDQFPEWSSERIRIIVEILSRSWGVGAFHMAEARCVGA